MVGVQRRFDDHNKRRAVKREKDTSISFFDDLEFAFLAQLQGLKLKVKDTEMVGKVKTYGGKVVTSLSKTVDYLVVLGTTLDDASAETQTAESLKIPIISSSFITKCILEGKLVDHTSSILAVPKKKKKAKADSDEEMEGEEGEDVPKKSKKTTAKKKAVDGEEGEEGEEEPKKTAKKATKKKVDDEEEEEEVKKKPAPKKGDKKRKAESDEEEEDEPVQKKKSKVDTDTKTPTTSTASTGSTINGLETLQPGTEWMGVCTDPVEDKHNPFILQVLKMERSKFEGFILWKTLNDAQHKISGKFAPNGNGGDLNVEIEEYIKDKLEKTYSGVLSGKSISGRVGDKSSKTTFKVDLIKSVSHKLRVPQTYKGTCKADTPFTLKISKRDGEDAEGTIEWQVAPPTVTKWRGKIEGLNMTVEEYEVVKGDEEFLLRTWKLAVNQDEALHVKTVDNETFVINLAN